MSAAFAISNHHCMPVAANDSMPVRYNVPEGYNTPAGYNMPSERNAVLPSVITFPRRCAASHRFARRLRAYDTRGNVTTLGSMGFVYDYTDQPVAVSGSASLSGRAGVNGADGATTGNYRYDGNLKRVKSVVNGKTIYNVYDAGGALVHVDAVSDGEETDYVSGPMGALARYKDGQITYLHNDHLGSAQSGTTSTGSIAWRERYTPFGSEIVGVAANDNQAGFTGHIKDSATGLNYMQARYYDPVIGRFLSIDPMTFMSSGGNPGYFNRYAYTFNDPINNFDPDGMQVAPIDESAKEILNEALKNPASTLAETNRVATEKGIPVQVQTGGTGVNNSEVSGGLTQAPVTFIGADGNPVDGVLVTLDPRDSLVVSGTNSDTGQTTARTLTMGETVEHELGNKSHTMSFLKTGDATKNYNDSVVGGDSFRANQVDNNGNPAPIPFVRGTHTPPVPGTKLVK